MDVPLNSTETDLTHTLPDLQHQLFLIGFHGRLYFAPLEEIKGGLHNVLDIGTGTGIWAIDFGVLFPIVKPLF
jgi:hypothetical protein